MAPQWPCDCVPWTKFGTVVVSLPVIGLVFCVVYSLLYDFTQTTRTHGCPAYNFLPSISAASGDKEPQISVWWWCIVIHTPGRYFISLCYVIFYSALPSAEWRRDYGPLAIACVAVNFIEVSALLSLTLNSSKSDFETHAISFGMFVGCATLYMLSVICIQSTLYKDTKLRKLSTSIRYKKMLFTGYCISVATTLYTYWRHNAYCESSVYSMFALSEYFVVLTNIAFHSTFMLDFTSHLDTSPSIVA